MTFDGDTILQILLPTLFGVAYLVRVDRLVLAAAANAKPSGAG